MLNLPTQEPAVGVRVGSCLLHQQSETAGCGPPSQSLLYRCPRVLPGPYDQKQDPGGFLESLLTRETGYDPAGPSLSRAPPDGAEQGMAGQDRAGQDRWALEGADGSR